MGAGVAFKSSHFRLKERNEKGGEEEREEKLVVILMKLVLREGGMGTGQ